MRKKSFLLFVILCCITLLVACIFVACNPDSKNQNGGLNDGNDGGPDDGGEIYYTVTFDSQGGSMVQSVRVKSGDKLTAPANPTRTSYNFGGWYKDSAYTKIWDFSVEQVTQDITLYARWIAEDGKIIAVENAKIDGLDIFMAVRNEVTDVRLANAVTIGGNAVWKLYLDKLGTQEIPTKIAASTNGILREGDNVFYIVSTSSDGQQVRTYTLTIHRSYYATVSVYDPYDKLYNTYIRETYFESFTPPAAFTGYTITSWNVSDDRWQNDGLIRQNTQFKPICQANKYTVNLNAQGGQCSSTSATLTYDSSYKLPVPTKTGYVFMGWSAYTSGGSFVTDDCGYSKANWKNAQSGGTLYAIWALGSYEVTARANDKTAGVVVGGGTYKYGSSVTLSATTNAGYTFVGWYEGEEKLSDDLTYSFTMPAANVTYTAVWQMQAEMEIFNFSSTPTDITILGVNDSDISAITIPSYSGVSVQIAEKAFSGCKNLTSVTIGNSVTSIGSNAFYDCYKLVEVYNKSNLSIVAGSPGNGYVAYYAKNVYTQEGGSKLTTDENGFIFYYDGATGYLVGYTGNENELVLSDGFTAYNGVTVNSYKIYGYAFYYCSGLTSVTIPDSVTSIGDYAFYNCSGLTSITIGDSVTSIGDYAFRDCKSLTSITIPDSVTSIGDYAFYNCSGLTSITIGDSVTSIGDYAFRDCKSLTSITIPDSVTSIGSSAFWGCSGLTSIAIPDSVTSIGEWAFYNCSGLTSITIPDSVTSIGSSAFSGCRSLEAITIPFVGAEAGKTSSDTYQYPFGYIFGTSSYTGGTAVEQRYYGSSTSSTTYSTYYIPSSLRSVTVTGGNILYGAFYNCSMLTSVTIGNGVTSIGNYAFRGCSGLTSITIPDSVTSIDNYAFSGCSGLTSITIPDSVTSIGEGAFYGCNSLTTISYTGDMQSWLGKNCHDEIMSSGRTLYIDGNKVEGAIVIPDGVQSVPSYAFCYQTGIISITIPDSVTSIGERAFQYCGGLTSIAIGNGVTSIGDYAFYDCSGLTSVTIGNSVTSIGSDAFAGCSGLTEINWNAASVNDFESGSDLFRDAGTAGDGIAVTFGDSVKKIPAYLFYVSYSSYRLNIKSVTIGNGVTSIGNYAFYNCSGLTSITIPDSVTSIGSSAFSGCRSLEAITIPFVGAEAGKTSSDTYQYPFGYIFGTSSYTGGTAVEQRYYGSSTSSTTYSTYYIPSSLRSVTVTGGNILYGAFYNCSMLTSVTIGNGVTSIGWHAFEGCSGLASIIIPDSVTSIGKGAFYNCSGLTSITIPDSVTSIGEWAFSGCSGLTSITIPDSVTSIGNYAFQSCDSLTSITIPDSVTSIGNGAFRNCIGLASVIFKNTNGWQVSTSSSFGSYASLSRSDLSNRSTAATYLKSTYEGYYWRRV